LTAATAAACGGGERERMPAQGAAFSHLRPALEAAFPGTAIEEPDVRWWTGPCPGTDTTAVVLGRRCYAGLYYRRGGIDVAWRGSVGASAYTHELMHYFLDEAGRGRDAAHTETALWALVERIDAELQNQGM
jgi:hypothetical protein